MPLLARTACGDEMRGHEQRQALNKGNAFPNNGPALSSGT